MCCVHLAYFERNQFQRQMWITPNLFISIEEEETKAKQQLEIRYDRKVTRSRNRSDGGWPSWIHRAAEACLADLVLNYLNDSSFSMIAFLVLLTRESANAVVSSRDRAVNKKWCMLCPSTARAMMMMIHSDWYLPAYDTASRPMECGGRRQQCTDKTYWK